MTFLDIYGTFQEVDDDGNVVDGGITNQTSVSLDLVKVKKTKNEFIGAKKGAVIVLDPKKAFENDTDAAAMLNIDKEAYVNMKAKFSFTVEDITSNKSSIPFPDFAEILIADLN